MEKQIKALKNGLKTLEKKYQEKWYRQEREIDKLNSEINSLQCEIDNLEHDHEEDKESYQEDIDFYKNNLEETESWGELFYMVFEQAYGNLKGIERQRKLNEFI
jgi:chromosome segregation ATPase